MTPLIPLLLLSAVLSAAPALAGDTSPIKRDASSRPSVTDFKTPAGGVIHSYLLPKEDRAGGYAREIKLAQKYLSYPDNAQVGGPNHVASFVGEACLVATGECLVLTEQLRDMILEQGEKVSPHVYGVVIKVVGAAAYNLKTIESLDKELWAHAGFDGSSARRTWTNQREASQAVVDILRAMMASPRSIEIDGYKGSVAKLGVDLASEFKDAGAFLEKDMKNNLASKDPVVLRSAIKAVGLRARNPDTLLRLAGLFLAQKKGELKMDDELQALALEQMADVARTLWPQRLDAATHAVWDEANIAPARNYFTLACGILAERGCGEKDEKTGQVPNTPVCGAASTLRVAIAKKHRATCGNMAGLPLP